MRTEEEFLEKAANDSGYAIAYALLEIAHQIKCLGNADAITPMGAIEALGAVFKENGESLASAVGEVSCAISQVSTSLDYIEKKIGKIS